MVILLIVASAAARLNTFLLTRKAEAVIAGLSKLQIDETSEAEVLSKVPFLVRGQQDREVTKNIELGGVETGTLRGYYASFSNESTWLPVALFATRFSTVTYPKSGPPKAWTLTLMDWLGYRYFSFNASVVLLDGKASSMAYGIADYMVFPRPIGDIVSAQSAHSYWSPHQRGFEVSSAADENPQLHIRDVEHRLRASFAFDASSAIKSHAFQVRMNCFWAFVGCRDARDVAPALWQDKNEIEAATLARLQSDDPCPERIIAGRVRYLPDLNVAVLEATKPENATRSDVGDQVTEMTARYKLIEAVRGHFPDVWQRTVISPTVPFPGDYHRRLPNKGLQWAAPGKQVLAFSNVYFDSCPLVLATPSARSVVKNTISAPRRVEDEPVGPLQ